MCHLELPPGDIVDRCRVWESHADTDDRRVVKPTPTRAQLVYTVGEPTLGAREQVVAAVTGGISRPRNDAEAPLPSIMAHAPPPSPVHRDLATMLTQGLVFGMATGWVNAHG